MILLALLVFWPLGLCIAVRGWRRTDKTTVAGKVYRIAVIVGVILALSTVPYLIMLSHAIS